MNNKKFEKYLDERIKQASDCVKRMEAGKIKATQREYNYNRGFLEACKVVRADYDYHRKPQKPVKTFKVEKQSRVKNWSKR